MRAIARVKLQRHASGHEVVAMLWEEQAERTSEHSLQTTLDSFHGGGTDREELEPCFLIAYDICHGMHCVLHESYDQAHLPCTA